MKFNRYAPKPRIICCDSETKAKELQTYVRDNYGLSTKLDSKILIFFSSQAEWTAILPYIHYYSSDKEFHKDNVDKYMLSIMKAIALTN